MTVDFKLWQWNEHFLTQTNICFTNYKCWAKNPSLNVPLFNVTWKQVGSKRRMLKAPPLKSLYLHFSVIKCHCCTYDDNIGPILKKLSFALSGLCWSWYILLILHLSGIKHNYQKILSAICHFQTYFQTF